MTSIAARTEHAVPALVALQAQRRPAALALAAGSLTITYGELDARANALAVRLRRLGVRRGDVVGLCIERSPAHVVAALGIMRAGAAYLPVDPRHPRERVAFQLDDAGAAFLVTGSAAPDRLRDDAHAVRVAPDGTPIDALVEAPAEVESDLDALAYVIYTSGSTGRPKGVEVTHGGLANLIAWHRAAFDVTENDRASFLSAVSFDAAVWEVWPYLSVGASVHVVDDDVAKDPVALREWLLSQRITIGFASTPLAERLIDLPWPTATPLRILLTGADRLHAYPRATLPFALVNNYGPTECTVVATSGVVVPEANAAELPSIGAPIANVDVYLVDEDGRLVPDGEEGEIWIGGAGVARGYRNRPDLTAQKFGVDPFSATPGARIYRTGDRGRRLPDGRFAFAERIDEQIKIRGFRVEPGEIEAALDAHPAVRESAVVACASPSGDPRLVAFLVLRTTEAPSASALRELLAKRVPEYMIPSTFALVPALPLTSSGKIDRAALRDREIDVTLEDGGYVAPRTPIEEQLVAIVAPLLKLESVSVHDDFFLLGGHSLLGTQLIARIYETFGVKLTLRTLFTKPTIAELASEVGHLRKTA